MLSDWADLIIKINRWLIFGLGAVVAGEALALLIGMNASSSEWARLKNNGLALLDLVTGAVLIYLLFARGDLDALLVFYVLLSVILISHGYREWEYVANRPNKFCENAPLFVVNGVKLVGAVGVLGISLFRRFLL